MSQLQNVKALVSASLLAIACGFSAPSMAEAVEQTVRIEVEKADGSAQCKVQAIFKGDHDNCKNDKAKGRADCSKESGCVCTRQEKHVTWKIENKQSFAIVFDQGSLTSRATSRASCAAGSRARMCPGAITSTRSRYPSAPLPFHISRSIKRQNPACRPARNTIQCTTAWRALRSGAAIEEDISCDHRHSGPA